MNIKILIADEDDIFREMVCDIIKKEGYIPVEAQDGRQAIDIFSGPENIDVVMLDVMIARNDGWAVLKEIREFSEVPVILLSALEDEKNEVDGLMNGADDYISKPLNYKVFVARLKTFVRKLKKECTEDMAAGNIKINQAAHRVSVDNSDIRLNRKEYSILIYFIKNRDRVLTREQILLSIWGYDFEGNARTIDTHIKTLRAKLSTCGGYIKTLRGTGYMFTVTGKEP